MIMDDIIRFLVSQVALCGTDGATPSKVFSFLDAYHNASDQPQGSNSDEFPGVEISTQDDARSSASMEPTIWKWLAQHPGISVGKGGQHSQVRFEDLLEHNKRVIERCIASHENTKSAKSSPDFEELHCIQDSASPILRLYASDERIWHAVAGHGIDHARIPPKDFQLLCIIARHRESGIVQPKLRELAQQDNRSVPMRTQRLCEAGYVAKLTTKGEGAWTSLLILKKFASRSQNREGGTTQPSTDNHPDATPVTSGLTQGKYGNAEPHIRVAFEILAETELIVWDDLKKKVGVWGNIKKSRNMAIAFRDFESLGIAKRVSAQSGEKGDTGKWHRCVKLLRNPSDEELRTLLVEKAPVQKALHGKTEHSTPVDSEQILAIDRKPASELPESSRNSRMADVEVPSAGTSVSWSPDRQMCHVIRDVVDRAGTSGITIPDIRTATVGGFYARPMEHLVGKLVEFPGLSQPAHLGHLGIIRDTISAGRANMYIHYAAYRLESLVYSGKISKETGLIESRRRLAPEDLDNFAFPKLDASKFKSKEQATALSQTVAHSYQQRIGLQKYGRSSLRRSRLSNAPLGRPRKYPKAGVPSDASLSETELKKLRRSQIQAKQYQNKKQQQQQQPDHTSLPEDLSTQLDDVEASQSLNILQPESFLKTPEKRGRPEDKKRFSSRPWRLIKGSQRKPEVRLSYSPSFFSHFIPHPTAQYQKGLEARRSHKLHLLEHSADSLNPMITRKTQQREPTHASEQDGRQSAGTRPDVSWLNPAAKSLDRAQQVQLIDRPRAGIFVGKTFELHRPGQRGRRPKSKMAVIKALALNDLPWFLTSEAPTPLANDARQDYASHAIGPSATGQRNEMVVLKAPRLRELPWFVASSPSTMEDSSLPPDKDLVQGVTNTGTPFSSQANEDAESTIRLEVSGGPGPEAAANLNEDIHTKTVATLEEPSLDHQPREDIMQPMASLSQPSISDTGIVNGVAITGLVPAPSHQFKRHASPGPPLAVGDILETPPPTLPPMDEPIRKRKRPSELEENTPKSAKRYTSDQLGRVSLTGGSIAVIRRQIVLDVVNAAGGVYPGNKEMWYPFTTLWMENHPGKPDPNTVKSAQKALVDTGKLKRITFGFQNKIGIAVTKHIVALPDINPDDDRVKELQEKMIAEDPRNYFPEGPKIAPAIRIDNRRKGPPQPRQAEEQRVNLHYIPVYLQLKRRRDEKDHSAVEQKRKWPRREATEEIATAGDEEPDLQENRAEDETAAVNVDPELPETLPEDEAAVEDEETNLPDNQTEDESADFRVPPVILDPLLGEQSREAYERVWEFEEPTKQLSKVEIRARERGNDLPRGLPTAPVRLRPLLPKPSGMRPPSQVSQSAPPSQVSQAATEIAPSSPPLPVKTRLPQQHGVKPRRLATLMDRSRQLPQPLLQEDEATKRTRHRGPQISDPDEGWGTRMFVATLLAKVLMGGLKQENNWEIVAAMLGDEVPVDRLKSKWNSVRPEFGSMLHTLPDDLREVVATGFEEDTIPPIDFGNPEGNDWKAVLDWTMETMDRSSFYTGLPSSRARIDDKFDVELYSERSLVSFYDDANTFERRRALLHKTAYIEALPIRSRPKAGLNVVDTAKTWVRAIVAAPEQTYDPEFSKNKLLALGDALVNRAVKNLRSERVLTQENKGRMFPGRQFDFSESYMTKLRNCAERHQLLAAAKFKRFLDKEFDQTGSAGIDMSSPDGTFLAVTNMLALNQAEIVQDKLPNTEGGGLLSVEQGYQTRKMDRSKMIFAMSLRPGMAFCAGNPLNMKVPPPRCEISMDPAGMDMAKIPMWYDINGNLVTIMWEIARATVASLLSLRPYLTLHLLAEQLSVFVKLFEVELVVQWLIDVGAAEWKDQRRGLVMLKEWWWMVLDESSE